MSTHTPAPPPPTQEGDGRPRRRWWLFTLIGAVVVVVIGAIGVFGWRQQQQSCTKAADPTRSGAVTEYCPSEPYQPFSGGGAMAFGQDGNLWYTDSQQKVVRFALPSGAVAEFAAPTAPNEIAYASLVRGSDGNLWYVANAVLGRMTMSGQFKEFALPKELGLVHAIAAGPNGMLWVTMAKDPAQQTALLKIAIPGDPTAAPQITQVATPPNTGNPMAVAQDGSLWASTFATSGDTILSTHITRITPAGMFTQLPVTIPGAVTALTAAPDGTMWFISASGQGQIGRITPAGATTFFRVSEIGEFGSLNLAVAPDGNVWFSTKDSRIARITPSGAVTTFSLPHGDGNISNITVGPDGGVWFLLGFSHPFQPSSRIVRITP